MRCSYKKIKKDALNPKAQRAIVSHADRYDSEKNVSMVLGLLRHVLAIDEDISVHDAFSTWTSFMHLSLLLLYSTLSR